MPVIREGEKKMSTSDIDVKRGGDPAEGGKKKKSVREAYTSFGKEVKVFYGPEDLQGFDSQRDLGEPGAYPFTRGIYPTMYRNQLWTMRPYAGMATSEETNKRFKFLLKSGQTGLSLAFDLPTQLGMDSDDPQGKYDVGKLGVAVDTLDDMERIFEDIPLDRMSTSFTINSTAAVILAMYVLVAKKQGAVPEQLRGTVQNDILKEYVARGTWIFSPKPSMRLIADTIEYCINHIPRFNPISVSATHLCEYGAKAEQSVSLPFLNALAYIDEVLKRGYSIDQVAPLVVFHMAVGGRNFHLFEDVAKLKGRPAALGKAYEGTLWSKKPRVHAPEVLYRSIRGRNDCGRAIEQHRPGGLFWPGCSFGRDALSKHGLL